MFGEEFRKIRRICIATTLGLILFYAEFSRASFFISKTERNLILKNPDDPTPELVERIQAFRMNPAAHLKQDLRYFMRFPYREIVDDILTVLENDIQSESDKHWNGSSETRDRILRLAAFIGESAAVGQYTRFRSIWKSISDWQKTHALRQIEENQGFNSYFSSKLEPTFEKNLKLVATRNFELKSFKKTIVSVHMPLVSKPATQSPRRTETPAAAAISADEEPDVPLSAENIETIRQLRKDLSERVIGQPDVVDGLVRLRIRAYRKQFRLKAPQYLYLMGHPGTGKDTSVNTYLDLIHHRKGAHEDHSFSVAPMVDESDMWTTGGSTSGHIGSQNLSDMIKFLVRHSGGRYRIREKVEGERTSQYVEKVENWKPGSPVPEGQFLPSDGVLFLNEFHDWSRGMKNLFLKQMLPSGMFSIKNPNGGESVIYVPITIAIASNEGMELVEPLNPNGKPISPPISEEEAQVNWERNHLNDEAKKNALLRTNGPDNSLPKSKDKGITTEMHDRLFPSQIILMRLFNKEDLKNIVRIKLRELKESFLAKGSPLGKIDFTFSDELIQFVQEHNHASNKAARAIEDKIQALIEKQVDHEIEAGRISSNLGQERAAFVTVKTNSDRTSSLVITGLEDQPIETLIEATLGNRPARPITDEELEPFLTLQSRLDKKVFGWSHVTERISRAALARAVSSSGGEIPAIPAQKGMYLGMTSTGKTYLASTLAYELYGSREKLVRINCSAIGSLEDLKQLVLGSRDASGGVIPSQVMSKYDRFNGEIVVLLDEMFNEKNVESRIPLLENFFDLFREPEVQFPDHARKMGRVKFLMTGNLGDSWYSGIPRDVPMMQQWFAMLEVYRQAQKNPRFLANFLAQKVGDAFVARVGPENIHFAPPLTFKALRQLTEANLLAALKRLAPTESTRGWNIRFADQNGFRELVEDIEREGFDLWSQAASIASESGYIEQEFMAKVSDLLLRAKVPNGADVIFRRRGGEVGLKDERGHIVYDIEVAGEKPRSLELRLVRKAVEKVQALRPEDQILTAFHEAGHELVRTILLGDLYRSVGISIVPGVTEINGVFLHYLGIARFESTQRNATTKKMVIAEIAGLLAGAVAQDIVTKGGVYDAGQGSDISRVTELAERAILNAGLSAEWGLVAPPMNADLKKYIADMSPTQKDRFYTIVRQFMTEARALAKDILLMNLENALIPMAHQLAEQTVMDEAALKEFYERHSLFGETQISEYRSSIDAAIAHRQNFQATRDGEFLPEIPLPTSVGNAEDVPLKARAADLASWEISPEASAYFLTTPATASTVLTSPAPPGNLPVLSCKRAI